MATINFQIITVITFNSIIITQTAECTLTMLNALLYQTCY